MLRRAEMTVLRQAGMIAAGLAMATTAGLVGVSVASASTPALKIKPGSLWTTELKGGGCEVDTFNSNGTFTSDLGGEFGTWSGGLHTLAVTWTGGTDEGLKFSGTFTRAPVKEYHGTFTFGVSQGKGQIVKGAVATWNGNTC
jgi:hypothetical protein